MPAEKTAKRKKQALGKGLGALIPDIDSVVDLGSDYFQCRIELIRPNRNQPRRKFPPEELESLCLSIKEQGIIQPLLLRKIDDGYELVAGERRLRAAKMAGLNKVPCVVKDVTDSQSLLISLVENIQREDLNPIEEAEAYHRLITEFKLTQDQAAARVGKSRSAIANQLRLKQLPNQIKTSIIDRHLSTGHARALLGLSKKTQQLAVWRTIIAKGLSVRATEALVNQYKNISKKAQKKKPTSEDIYFAGIADELSRIFGTKVRIRHHGQRGRVEIEFYGNEDLNRLLNLLDR